MEEQKENIQVDYKSALGNTGNRLLFIAAPVGLVVLLITFFIGLSQGDNLRHFWHSYLFNFMFFLTLSLGALFWVVLQHLTRSYWGVVLRRLGEIIAGNLPLLAVLLIPVLAGIPALYLWADQSEMAHNSILAGKKPYLNVPFFIIRLAIYGVLWTLISRFYLTRSVKQDQTGDVNLTKSLERFSAPAIVLFAITLNFAAFDLVMSLAPLWFSSIFGVYIFASSVMGFIAFLVIITFLLQWFKKVNGEITVEHYHDLGKHMFASVFFWGYIAFSQFMLMWYANIPEETSWYLPRMTTSWVYISGILLVGHLIIPFVILLTREIKRTKIGLVLVALWLLLMHWIDMYWLIMPQFNPEGIPFHLMDIGCLVGIGGLYIAGLARLATGKSLVPTKDPRLEESLEFENAP